MIKFIGGVAVGVFVGALTVEVLGRTHPEVLEKVEERARRAAERLSDLVRRPRLRDDMTGSRGPTASGIY